MTVCNTVQSIASASRLCGGCGLPCHRQWRFCRACGWDFAASTELDQYLVLPSPDKVIPGTLPPGAAATLGCAGSLIRFGVFGFIGMVILSIIAIPNFRHGSREGGRERACYANMRVILGAVEMYNMDHSVMVTTIQDRDVDTNGFLIQAQYLKSRITKPETDCSYGTTGDLTGTGKIICARHGTVEE